VHLEAVPQQTLREHVAARFLVVNDEKARNPGISQDTAVVGRRHQSGSTGYRRGHGFA
jgi:hypothetical protein